MEVCAAWNTRLSTVRPSQLITVVGIAARVVPSPSSSSPPTPPHNPGTSVSPSPKEPPGAPGSLSCLYLACSLWYQASCPGYRGRGLDSWGPAPPIRDLPECWLAPAPQNNEKQPGILEVWVDRSRWLFLARASWPQHDHFQPVKKGDQDAQMLTHRGKGGVGSDFLREAVWRLGEKFPLQHMTHAALSPFPAWATPLKLD